MDIEVLVDKKRRLIQSDAQIPADLMEDAPMSKTRQPPVYTWMENTGYQH